MLTDFKAFSSVLVINLINIISLLKLTPPNILSIITCIFEWSYNYKENGPHLQYYYMWCIICPQCLYLCIFHAQFAASKHRHRFLVKFQNIFLTQIYALSFYMFLIYPFQFKNSYVCSNIIKTFLSILVYYHECEK